MALRVHVDVVSAEESIFSGEAEFAVFPGEAGELGIMPRHTALLTRIKGETAAVNKDIQTLRRKGEELKSRQDLLARQVAAQKAVVKSKQVELDRTRERQALLAQLAAVTAWRYRWSWQSPAAKTPGMLVAVEFPSPPQRVRM